MGPSCGGVLIARSLSLRQAGVNMYVRSGSGRGSCRRVYFDELSGGILELCGFPDASVLQNRLALREAARVVVLL